MGHVTTTILYNRAKILLLLLCILGGGSAHGQTWGELKKHIKADPLTISGNLGTSLQCIWGDNDTYASASPFALTSHAYVNVNIYDFSIPIHVDLMNVSSVQFSFPMPEVNVCVMPTWKQFRLHLGTSSMDFSNYTYSGLNFTGVGAEYMGDIFHVSGFYGIMQAATQFKEYDDRSALQYMADSLLGLNVQDYDEPQFKRMGYGARIGVGNEDNHLDLSFFKAKDDTTSLPRFWHSEDGDTLLRDSLVCGKENLALGLSGRFTINKWFSFQANVGASLFTPDHRSSIISRQSLLTNGLVDSADSQTLNILGLVEDASWLYEPRMNSQFRFAGDAAMSFSFSNVNAILSYRFVQADYTTLGSSRFSQNVHGVGLSGNVNLFEGSTTLMLTSFLQHDNLDRKQMYTNQVFSYSTGITSTIGENVNLALTYNGVKQDQFDGLYEVKDSTRIDQLAHNITLTPSYSFEGDDDRSHEVSLNLDLVQNKNLNPLMSNLQDVNTLTLGTGYELSLPNIGLEAGLTYDFSVSESPNNSYSSHAIGANCSYVVAKSKTMNLKLGYVMSFALNFNEEEVDDEEYYDPENPIETAKTRDISFSNRLSVSFSYKKRHTAALSLSSSNYSEHIVIGQKITSRFDLRLTFSYSYSFASRIIKAKKKKDEEVQPDITK